MPTSQRELHHDQDNVEELAAAAAAGDEAAMAALYEHYMDPIYRFVYSRLRDHSRTEDVVGQTWLKVCRGIRNYRTQGGGFTSWIFAITRNVLTDLYRAEGRSKELPTADMYALDGVSNVATPEEEALNTDAGRAIAQAMRSLPRAQAQAINLRFFTGLTVEETAQVMGVSVASCKTSQHRGLKALRKLLPNLRHLDPAASVTSVVAAPSTSSTESVDNGDAARGRASRRS